MIAEIIIFILVSILAFLHSTLLFVAVVVVGILVVLAQLAIAYLSGENFEIQKETPTSFEHRYGVDHEIYDTFKNYKEPEHEILDIQSEEVDADNNMIKYMREQGDRCRKTKENINAKTADFYKHHFSNELDANQDLEWWGRYED